MTTSLAGVLRAAADDSPTRVFIKTRAATLTYAECAAAVDRRIEQLLALGVGPGDPIALMMVNSTTQVELWLALNHLGALHVPLNTALRGTTLAHPLGISGARLVLCDDDVVTTVRTTVAANDLPVRAITLDQLPAVGVAPRHETPEPDPLSTATLLFTSGTTGRSKACALSHHYLLRQGQLHAEQLGLRRDDVLYCPFPLFHIDAATLTVAAALSVRATAALGLRFSASGFWEEVRDVGATVFNFMGATLTILWNREPSDRDRDHAVRLAWGVPMPAWQREFEARFAVPLRQVYGSTDAGVPVYDPPPPDQRRGAAGRVIPAFEVRIDLEARRLGDPADVGEILVRGREPGLTMNGYHGDPQATAETIDDGWVRTGDLGALDADDYLTFHGRLSDSIRRRGENISAAEVESLVSSHPAVVEAAAVGVPSDLTEEEVLVWVVLRNGANLTPAEIRDHCLEHGPRHMAPRYVRIVAAVPRTPTEKAEKHRLREVGITPDTWDAEAGRTTS